MSTPALDLSNIQGDVLPSLPKKSQVFLFFKINGDVNNFKAHLKNLIPILATGTGVLKSRDDIAEHKRCNKPGLCKSVGINIAFSKEGLAKLGLNTNANDKLGDNVFDQGMFSDAQSLGDKGVVGPNGTFQPAWNPAFIKQDIDGVIMIAGDSQQTIDEATIQVFSIFNVGRGGASLTQAAGLVGIVRPGAEDGHEHFGFEDGISNPAVNGVDTPNPGQNVIDPGVILLGRQGDTVTTRPSWALDGTFLAFRQLSQLVPEFDNFLTQNAIKIDDPSAPRDLGKELLGARLVGRWKSGAPIESAPLKDDPTLAKDASKNNNFDFKNDAGLVCPFAAHIRKTNPRADLAGGGLLPHLILRRGIPYGPEVEQVEAASHTTRHDRGLLFVSYQSQLSQGFQFIQKNWANNTNFIFGKQTAPGFDPIIGQTSDDGPRTMSGTGLNNINSSLSLNQDWVVSKGGAYFFVPSIAALKQTFAAATPSGRTEL